MAMRLGGGNLAARAEALYKSIQHMDQVLAITVVSNLVLPMRVKTGVVFAHRLSILAYASDAHLALFTSELHRAWALPTLRPLGSDQLLALGLFRYVPATNCDRADGHRWGRARRIAVHSCWSGRSV